jgi:hypothetical protein
MMTAAWSENGVLRGKFPQVVLSGAKIRDDLENLRDAVYQVSNLMVSTRPNEFKQSNQ